MGLGDGGGIRAGIAPYTDADDVDRLVAAVERALDARRGRRDGRPGRRTTTGPPRRDGRAGLADSGVDLAKVRLS